MRQAGVSAQHTHRGLARHAGRFGDGERCKGVGYVVASTQAQLARGHYCHGTTREPFLTVAPHETIITLAWHIETEGHGVAGADGRRGQRVLAIEHRDTGTEKNTLLGGRVAGHIEVAVEMIRRHVEYRRHISLEIQHGIELETR